MPLTLTVTVSGLEPGTSYHLYRYDSVASGPGSAFNADRAAASWEWAFTAGSSTCSISRLERRGRPPGGAGVRTVTGHGCPDAGAAVAEGLR